MSDLVVATVKIAFLAGLWLFIALIANVIRTDLFGRRVPTDSLPALSERPGRAKRRKPKAVPNTIVVTQGPMAGTAFELVEVVNIGRSPDSTINLDDDFITTRHAQMVRSDDATWMITDLRSTNGTYVDGKQVTGPTPVGLGSVIRLGRTQLTLERR